MKKSLIILSMLCLPLMACTQSPILTPAKYMSCDIKEFADLKQKQTCLINLAKKNNLKAQGMLVWSYKFKKDEKQYVYWKKKYDNQIIALAKKGDPEAQIYLGYYYQNGGSTVIKYDEKQALYWYNKALDTLKPLANKGNASAQIYLSDMYFMGTAVEENKEKAIEWLIKPAKQNNLMAQVKLTLTYLNMGDYQRLKNLSNDKTNYVKAYAWASIAEHNVSAPFTRENLGTTLSHINADQKKQGDELKNELLKTIKNK